MIKTVIVIIIAIAAVGIGALILVNSKADDTSPNNSATTSQASTNDTAANREGATNNQPDAKDVNPADAAPQSSQADAASTITYSNDGFSPATLSVPTGTTVTIKNNASAAMQFASDPHPQHTDNPELNAGSLASGQAKTITVKKSGTFGFHNHLKSADKGSITVQ